MGQNLVSVFKKYCGKILKNTSNWGENTYVLLSWSTPRERGTPSMIRAYKRAVMIVFSSEFWKPLPEIKE